MNHPFGVTENGQIVISGTAIDEGCVSMRLVSGAGIEVPEGWGERAQENADLLERRLARLEQALGLLPLSIPGVDSSVALAAAISNADLISEFLKPLSAQ
ncbi:hypothetical protein JFT59_26445 [Pseudomonas sp. MF6784]|jgi:phage tail sheath gpL-like|uniref:hypothetical protein n=1 Tax=Pseudomonas sp. MF6784 TaxID=2797535 RepID=UPI0018E83B53|nr:hypothetical protein [Pseudomonas sp. MF6784]MBJ2254737.1 hypothetical protein [Pseudomonas sp. MF6784]